MKKLIMTLAAAALFAVSGFAALPVNPNATPDVRKVLTYLAEVSAHNRVLSGQESPFDMKYVRHIQEVTGKWPAIIGLDFYCEDTISYRPGMIATAIEYWRAGGLVTICWHETSPKEAEPDAGGWKSVRSSMSQEEFNEVVTPGTLLFDRWAANVDIIAAYLQDLRDSGVVVMWRPYHEMNATWFWWGGKEPSSFKKLWYNLYDRLTNYWGLNNLIWVWSPSSAVNAACYQPDLVDAGGVDHYTHSRHDNRWITQDAMLTMIMGGKPHSITECGLAPDPEYLRASTGYSWFLVWAFGWCDNTAFGKPPANGPGNRPEQLRALYRHPVCITRDEVFADLDTLSDWAGLAAPPADLPNPFHFAAATRVAGMPGRQGHQAAAKVQPRISGWDGWMWDYEEYIDDMAAYLPGSGKPGRTRKSALMEI
jgi:mannan endo-1,4-beta-mannosidase